MSLPQNGPKNIPPRKPRKPRDAQVPTKHPYDQSSYPPGGIPQAPYPSSQQQPWSSSQSQPQSTFHGQSTMPFQPGQIAPGFQPPPPPRVVSPASKKKRPGGCMIGLGLLLLLFLCGGINAIVHSQNTQQAQTGTTNKGSQTVAVATMPPRATTQLQTTRSTQSVAVPTSPAKLEPTPPPVQPTLQSTTPAQPTPQPTMPPAQPTPQPTTPAAPACQGVSGNPWCYDFNATGGSTISSPPQDFCTYFTCIKSFWQSTNGYIVECADQQYSHSGGVRGACSRNGGVMNILYQH